MIVSVLFITMSLVFAAPEKQKFTLQPAAFSGPIKTVCKNEKNETVIREADRSIRSNQKTTKSVYNPAQRKFADVLKNEVISFSNVRVNGRPDNSSEKYLWQLFSSTFIKKQKGPLSTVGTIEGTFDNARQEFVVGDVFSYTFLEKPLPPPGSKGGAKPRETKWFGQMSVLKTEEMNWNNRSLKVFVIKETLKPASPSSKQPGKTMISYFSPEVNKTIRTEFTTDNNLRSDCIVETQKK